MYITIRCRTWKQRRSLLERIHEEWSHADGEEVVVAEVVGDMAVEGLADLASSWHRQCIRTCTSSSL
jgi:hypothetical protein